MNYSQTFGQLFIKYKKKDMIVSMIIIAIMVFILASVIVGLSPTEAKEMTKLIYMTLGFFVLYVASHLRLRYKVKHGFYGEGHSMCWQ